MNPKDWDIICIQEPYLDFQGLSRATNAWTAIYPPKHKKGEKTRSLILVSTRLATDAWEALPMDLLDITVVKLTCNFGQIPLFNLYNACKHANTTTALAKYLTNSAMGADTSVSVYDIWVGDFNHHDPMWENPQYKQLFTHRHLDDAEVVINMLADYGMDMALPPGIPTLEHMVSKELHRVDQVFISAELSDYIIKCNTLKHCPPCTDHYPITTTIDLNIARTLPTPGPNFRATDWPEFRKELKSKLDRLPLHDPQNAVEFKSTLDDLMNTILTTIETNVPKTRPSSYMKRWWTKELSQMRARTRALGKKSYHARINDPTHPVHEEHRRARNDYTELIDSSKKDCWDNFVTGTEEKTMYIINKFTTVDPTDGRRTRIPTLKITQQDGTTKEVADNQGKGEALHKVFFTPPATEGHVPPNFPYPTSPEAFKAISDKQIH